MHKEVKQFLVIMSIGFLLFSLFVWSDGVSLETIIQTYSVLIPSVALGYQFARYSASLEIRDRSID